MVSGLVLGVSHAPTPTGCGPSAPQFWGFLFIYAHTLYCRTTKLDLDAYNGSLFLGVSRASTPRRWPPALPDFWSYLLFKSFLYN